MSLERHKLLRKTKICYYENLNVKCIHDNKNAWKDVKPLFSQKGCINNRVTLVEDNEIIYSKCAEIMNNFFTDSVLNLEINRVLHTDVFNSADLFQLQVPFRNIKTILLF